MSRSLLALALALVAGTAGAQSYEVSWWTVDGGGSTASTGATLAVGSTSGQPDAGGPFAGAPYVLHSGFWALAAGGAGGPQADLAISKTDGQSAATAGTAVTYTIVATNAGPANVSGAPVTDVPPPSLTGVAWTCAASVGSACPASGTGGIAVGVSLLAGGSATFTLTGTIHPTATGTLVNSASIAAPNGVLESDPTDNQATDIDTILPGALRAEAELAHGTGLRADLASVAGTARADLYRVRQQPYASYEVVVDETSGDVGAGAGPLLDLVGADGSTVLQSSRPVGAGPSRSLRVVNQGSTAIDAQLIRVRSASCTSDCAADDVYRVRARETTASVARFNNANGQSTFLFLQNRTNDVVGGVVYAWSTPGSLAGQQAFALLPHGLLVMNMGTLAPGAGGSLTVVHDGPYGSLAGKTVALEPATGFSFDAPLESRPR